MVAIASAMQSIQAKTARFLLLVMTLSTAVGMAQQKILTKRMAAIVFVLVVTHQGTAVFHHHVVQKHIAVAMERLLIWIAQMDACASA